MHPAPCLLSVESCKKSRSNAQTLTNDIPTKQHDIDALEIFQLTCKWSNPVLIPLTAHLPANTYVLENADQSDQNRPDLSATINEVRCCHSLSSFLVIQACELKSNSSLISEEGRETVLEQFCLYRWNALTTWPLATSMSVATKPTNSRWASITTVLIPWRTSLPRQNKAAHGGGLNTASRHSTESRVRSPCRQAH
jgi:hypothetical protein